MEYVQLKHAKSYDIVIFAKRFWTKDGKRIVANLGGMRAGFDSAAARSITKAKGARHFFGREAQPNPARKMTKTANCPSRDSANHALYAELRTFAEEMGWSLSRTGQEIQGDTQFIFGVRDGRHPKPETLARVRQRMQDLRDGRNEVR